MRILQVVPSYFPATIYGGPIFSIHYACQALARLGVHIHVSTTNANGDTKLNVTTSEPEMLELNYYVHYYEDTITNRFSWAFTRWLWRDIKKADLVHLQDIFSPHAAWTLMLSWFLSKPILLSVRGVFTPWGLKGKRPGLKKIWIALLVRPFMNNRNRVAWHVTAESEKDETLAVFPESRIFTIPNGIDLSAFDSVQKISKGKYLQCFYPDCNIPLNRVKILVGLGRLHAKKSFDIAIKSFHKVAKRNNNIVLLIAGADDGEYKSLSRLIVDLKLENRVVLIGEVKGDDKITFLKGADLFLFPSHNENFGMTCLEALASCLPVVASRNTPWSEVETENAGLWVNNTVEDFAEATEELLSRNLDPMGVNAYNCATRYDLTVVASAFKKTYSDLIT